jgi:hypothetical protein
VEKGGRKANASNKGYVHRLDQVATSFFFTNFPAEITAADLWPKFGHFDRVGEVYIPDRLDKQGRRFGFVKYRDVRDPKEQLGLLSDIWVGTYKLRVNLARFTKGTGPKEVGEEAARQGKAIPTTGVGGKAVVVEGKSYREALKVRPLARQSDNDQVVGSVEVGGSVTVTWEVEVETEAVNMLKGSYVGLLTENKDHQSIQRSFIMDGYQHIRVKALGHMKVLISSSVEGEVKEIANSVGWWCTVFEKFEEWSPSWVSNQRVVWLNCYGVPLHVWGEALFRSLGFKFGTYIETDIPTNNMTRVDVAKIKVATDASKLIDSSISVSVLDKKIVIRVLEETGSATMDELRCCGGCEKNFDDNSYHGSGEGETPAVEEEGSEGGDDSDWSETRHGLVDVGTRNDGKGVVKELRMVVVQEKDMADSVPTFLGNSLEGVSNEVNVNPEVSAGKGKESSASSGSISRALEEGESQGEGTTEHMRPLRIGPCLSQPNVLRTKAGDFKLHGSDGGVSNGPCDVMGGKVLGPTYVGLNSSATGVNGGSLPPQQTHLLSTDRCCKGGKTKKATKRPHPYFPGHKFYKFQNCRKGGSKLNKKAMRHEESVSLADSDSIETTKELEQEGGTCQQFYDAEGIDLEVFLPHSGIEDADQIGTVVPCSLSGHGGSGVSGLGDLLAISTVPANEVPLCGAGVDKERGDAYHLIDIQEDVGLNFKGVGDEDVKEV